MKKISKILSVLMLTMAISAPFSYDSEPITHEAQSSIESTSNVVESVANVVTTYYKFRVDTKIKIIETKYDIKSTFWTTVYDN